MDSLRCLGACDLGAEPLIEVGVFGPLGAGLPARLLWAELTEPSDGLGELNWPRERRLRCRDEEEAGREGPRAGVESAEGNKSILARLGKGDALCRAALYQASWD